MLEHSNNHAGIKNNTRVVVILSGANKMINMMFNASVMDIMGRMCYVGYMSQVNKKTV